MMRRLPLLTTLVLVSVCGAMAAAEPVPFRAGLGGINPVPPGRDVCWTEPADLNGVLLSAEVIDEFGLESEWANDFVPTADLVRCDWWGGYFAMNYPCDAGFSTPGFNVRIYEDAGCVPGGMVADLSFGPGEFTEEYVDCVGFDPLYKWGVDTPLHLTAGNRYWFSPQMKDHPYEPMGGRLAAFAIRDCSSMFRAAYFGFPDWIPIVDLIGIEVDPSQEFTCAGATSVAPSTWGRIKGQYR